MEDQFPKKALISYQLLFDVCQVLREHRENNTISRNEHFVLNTFIFEVESKKQSLVDKYSFTKR